MKKTLFILIALMGALPAKAQKAYEPNDLKSDTRVYTAVEHEPEPAGGMTKFFDYIAKNIHPVGQNTEDAYGRFLVQMIIEKDGKVSHIKALKDGCYTKLTTEIKRIIKVQPKWKPATQYGHPVRYQISFPIYLDPGMGE